MSEPEWLAPYIERKAGQFMATLGADAEHEWIGPGGNLQSAASELVRDVVTEVAFHLAAPHGGPGPDPVQEAQGWAAGS